MIKPWVRVVLAIAAAALIFWLGANYQTMNFNWSSAPKPDDLSNCQQTYTDASGEKRCMDRK